MSDLRLVVNEFRYQRRSFRRDPQAMFFAIGLPLLYVVIFVSLFGNETLEFVYDGQPGPLKAHTVMLAGFIALKPDNEIERSGPAGAEGSMAVMATP